MTTIFSHNDSVLCDSYQSTFNWSEGFLQEYFDEENSFYDLPHENEGDSIFKQGDDAMREFCRVLTEIPGYDPFEYQLTLMNIIVELAIPTFYWNVWKDHKQAVLERYGVNRIPTITSSCASRRDGKSTFFQMVVAALLLCSPPRKDYTYGIGLVSINLAGSKKMIEDIGNMLKTINYPGVKIDVTATRIEVTHPCGGVNRAFGFQTGNVSDFECVCMWVLKMN